MKCVANCTEFYGDDKMNSSDYTLSNCQCYEGYVYSSGECQIVCPVGYDRISADECQKILTCAELGGYEFDGYCYMDNSTDCSSVDGCKICGTNNGYFVPYV